MEELARQAVNNRTNPYAGGVILTELMSTVHTETSAAFPKWKTDAKNSKSNRCVCASGIVIHVHTTGLTRILLQVRGASCCSSSLSPREADKVLEGRLACNTTEVFTIAKY